MTSKFIVRIFTLDGKLHAEGGVDRLPRQNYISVKVLDLDTGRSLGWLKRCAFCGEWFYVEAAPLRLTGPRAYCSKRCGRLVNLTGRERLRLVDPRTGHLILDKRLYDLFGKPGLKDALERARKSLATLDSPPPSM